jgi:hypothetical protein
MAMPVSAAPGSASPLRPSVAIGGHSVNGALSRATRPRGLACRGGHRAASIEPLTKL